VAIALCHNPNPRFAKLVAWSDEDQCGISTCPGLLYGGCHGDDKRQVLDELCQIVDEVIALDHADGKPLPPATAERIADARNSG
jgi:hypothetical protein